MQKTQRVSRKKLLAVITEDKLRTSLGTDIIVINKPDKPLPHDF